MRKLKIAQIAPLWYPVPPEKYGGVELIISLVTEELVSRGHDVYLFASKESKTRAKLVSFYYSPKKMGGDATPLALLHTRHSFDYIYGELSPDIIHSHLGADQFSLYFEPDDIPCVNTAHNDVPSEVAEYFSEAKVVSISNAHKKYILGFKHYFTVYNGIDISSFDFNHNPRGGYLAFLGRMDHDKNPAGAVRVAEMAGEHLKMVAKLENEEYFNVEIKSHLSRDIEYLGEIPVEDKSSFLANAKALIAPINWQEPFGLYFIEAMATGTPVITFDRGAAKEIVKDGITGFVCPPDDYDCMVKAVKKIDHIDRLACRKHVEDNFTVKHMVDNYEKVYRQVLDLWQ